jgi:hypothetical protein
MDTTHPIDALSQSDRNLIETAIARRFNLHDLIDPKSPHPAQQTLSSLVRWLDRPLIKLAIDVYMAIFTRSAACAAALDAPHQAAALKSTLQAALHMLHNAPTPTDEAHAEVISKRNQSILREARFLLAAINRFNPFPRISLRKPSTTTLTQDSSPASPRPDNHADVAEVGIDEPAMENPRTSPSQTPSSIAAHFLPQHAQGGRPESENSQHVQSHAKPPGSLSA